MLLDLKETLLVVMTKIGIVGNRVGGKRRGIPRIVMDVSKIIVRGWKEITEDLKKWNGITERMKRERHTHTHLRCK